MCRKLANNNNIIYSIVLQTVQHVSRSVSVVIAWCDSARTTPTTTTNSSRSGSKKWIHVIYDDYRQITKPSKKKDHFLCVCVCCVGYEVENYTIKHTYNTITHEYNRASMHRSLAHTHESMCVLTRRTSCAKKAETISPHIYFRCLK